MIRFLVTGQDSIVMTISLFVKVVEKAIPDLDLPNYFRQAFYFCFSGITETGSKIISTIKEMKKRWNQNILLDFIIVSNRHKKTCKEMKIG